MKTISILISITLLLSVNTLAQTNRANTKKSVAYRANYQRIASGHAAQQTFEIRGGSLWAWGTNFSGQLGDGTNTHRNSPVQIGTDTKWISISTGAYFTLGLKADGTLWAWGQNIFGQLGDGTTTDRSTPAQIGSDNNWISIATGAYHGLGLKSNGTLWAWGWNRDGSIGDGTTTFRYSPIQIGTDNKWTVISAGYSHSHALKSDGTLWAWGNNNIGELGDGTTTQRNSPVQTGTDNKWVNVISGSEHVIGLKVDGTLWAWGFNDHGQIGDGTTINRTTPVQIGSNNTWVGFSGGGAHSLGLKSDGTLWAWGRNSRGSIGDGTNTHRSSPVQIGTDNKWVSVSGGSQHSIGLKSDGTLWSWGENSFGEVGDGTNTDRNSPVQTSITLSVWVSVKAGGTHSLGLKSDGTLWAWGFNLFYGQIGDGTTINRLSPVQIGTDNKWVSITAGGTQSLGLKSDGTLWAWGYNRHGTLGDGTAIDRHSPVRIGTDNKWVSITAGVVHSIGLKSDGTLWAWGNNALGQLGDGTITNRHSPVQIGTDTKWVSITASGYHSLGLKSDGTLWAWGLNNFGQLGDGTITNKTSPVQIGTDTKWVSISGGGPNPDGHTLGLKSDGTLWAWGLNNYGQLGDGTIIQKTSPLQIGTDNKWINISAGGYHSLGLKSDGTLWAWGLNGSGQLGDGTWVQKTSPVQIGTNTWVSITAGGYHSLGLKADRSLFCATGGNSFGHLGDGTTQNRHSFVCNTNPNCFMPPAPTGTNVAICYNNTASLSATGTGTLGWYSAATAGTYLGGGTSYITPSLTSNTTYYVQDSTCAASATRAAVLVTVNALPVANITPGGPTTFCQGGSVTLTASSGTSYLWSNNTTASTLVANTSGNYSVRVTDENGCSNTSVTITTSVNPLPSCSISVTPANTIYTGGDVNKIYLGYGSQSVTLTATSNGDAPFTYSWSGSYLSGNGATRIFTPLTEGSYNIICTTTNVNGCQNTCIVTICVLDIRSGGSGNSQKVYLCHVPSGNPSNTQTLDISVNVVPNHLSTHSGDHLGSCSQNCGMGKKASSFVELTHIEEIIIYPNPNSGLFTIDFNKMSGDKTIKVYDLSGKFIKELQSENKQVEINVEELAKGFYILKIYNEGKTYTRKIVVQ
ncbi:MAG: T9SS type A sorting domain-containing protein [Bacteroidota bacterium]|nr:T9SS type A sorting domain-containing protein [Bacteroidota bacterium]